MASLVRHVASSTPSMRHPMTRSRIRVTARADPAARWALNIRQDGWDVYLIDLIPAHPDPSEWGTVVYCPVVYKGRPLHLAVRQTHTYLHYLSPYTCRFRQPRPR